jgi:hypothetical protein
MLGQQSNNIYLNIISGRIHRRVPQGTEGATSRTLQDGKIVHEQIFSFVEGVLTNIEMREGDYGKQWMLNFEDKKESYVLQVSETSGYGDDLLTKIPALDKNQTYRVVPYEYTSKQGKKRAKLKIIYDEEQVNSCYHKFTQVGEGWKVDITDPKYPKPQSDQMDSEEWKIYFMQVRKYLREKALTYLSNWSSFEKTQDTLDDVPDDAPDHTDDDLPF